VSATAESLYTSQPGVSKQIRLLEDELGVEIFERSGRQLTRITSAGQTIIELAEHILSQADAMRQAAHEYRDAEDGSLSIATTHTQARYALPPVVSQFHARYPRVSVHMHQGSPMQISELTANGVADFAIATEALEYFEDLVMMPCYYWRRAVLVPPDHPLTRTAKLTLETVAQYPIVTYVFGFAARSQLEAAFKARGLRPQVALTATDADVIKTYVRLGLGVGIVAGMAYDERNDSDLRLLEAGELFERSTTKIGFRRGTLLRSYMYDFIELFAAHLTREVVERAARAGSSSELEKLFAHVSLPTY
jgi:LysR family cys regulon transcriptional activator